jgi:hypothetical protein
MLIIYGGKGMDKKDWHTLTPGKEVVNTLPHSPFLHRYSVTVNQIMVTTNTLNLKIKKQRYIS